MLKRIGITMRMQTVERINELRDTIAHDWVTFFQTIAPETILIPIPNFGDDAAAYAKELNLEGIILSGGDNWGLFPLRDRTETAILNWAIQQNIPVLGVCRGMQVMNHTLGGKLPTLEDADHIATRHVLKSTVSDYDNLEVNSYHRFLLVENDIATPLEIWAQSEDISIEAVKSRINKLIGIMWHPEREPVPTEQDIRLIHSIFREE